MEPPETKLSQSLLRESGNVFCLDDDQYEYPLELPEPPPPPPDPVLFHTDEEEVMPDALDVLHALPDALQVFPDVSGVLPVLPDVTPDGPIVAGVEPRLPDDHPNIFLHHSRSDNAQPFAFARLEHSSAFFTGYDVPFDVQNRYPSELLIPEPIALVAELLLVTDIDESTNEDDQPHAPSLNNIVHQPISVDVHPFAGAISEQSSAFLTRNWPPLESQNHFASSDDGMLADTADAADPPKSNRHQLVSSDDHPCCLESLSQS